jgi:hypothetical protein
VNPEIEKALRCLALELPEEVYNDAIPMIKGYITDIVAENERLKKALQDYFDDEKKIHELVSPYVPDIVSESGQKTLTMITGELVKELAMYKRAMELLDREWENAYSARVRNCYTIKYFIEKAQAEQEASEK